MDSAFIGTILPVAYNWAPRGWLICDGSTLEISKYQALFALIGNYYGGDGKTSFALPDLRGRNIVSPGTGPGLPYNVLWAKPLGAANASFNLRQNASVPITANNLPPHTHTAALTPGGLTAQSTLQVSQNTGGQNAPSAGATLCNSTNMSSGSAAIFYQGTPEPLVQLGTSSVSTTVGGAISATLGATGTSTPAALPVAVNITATCSTLQPSLALNFIICCNGYFPMRN